MKLYHIALNNLNRRKTKLLLVVMGLVIGIATTVSVYTVVEAMKAQMTRQMAEFGANVVVTPDTGELAFSYGGITIPEVLFDVEKLTMDDVTAIGELPSQAMIRAVAPKLLGVARSGHKSVIVAGSNLKSEFAIKPWLRLKSGNGMEEAEPAGSGQNKEPDKKDMDAVKIDLTREDLSQLEFGNDVVLLGSKAAEKLGVMAGDKLAVAGLQFRVLGVLEENGSAEDEQVMMNLAVAQKLLGRPGELTVIEISADYNLGSEGQLLAALETALPHAKITSLRQAVLGRDEMLTRLTRFGGSVSVLVLLAGMLVVMLTMSAAVRERTREIGIMRAIGFRKSHITKIILLEGTVVSLVGGVAGYALGIGLALAAAPLLTGMSAGIPKNPLLLLAAIAGSLALGAVSSLYPARQASSLDPAEALRFM